jgi:uncharacterized protein YqeY
MLQSAKLENSWQSKSKDYCMDIPAKLIEDMKTAMKSGDKVRLETIRGLRSQMKNVEIDKGRSLTEDEVIQVLNNAAKKRRESIEQFKLVNRFDRASEEQKELEIIQEYLPRQMTEKEIEDLVTDAMRNVNANSPSDMGKVMGAVMPQLKGRADGKLVQKIVQQKLATL